ncbi:hypothetical protein RI129_004056 [Pyrocoelia pectoralis]|uniref:Uncharacterized protein n=1 Tax=Pyrocoelia pectoralis TaxID=417401 RepID=A0AAN7VQU2_9COLE
MVNCSVRFWPILKKNIVRNTSQKCFYWTRRLAGLACGSSYMATNYCPNFDEASYHRSCREEIINPIHGKVSGTIPKWLNGTLIRNGPGLFEINKSTVSHWFDGMALLHRFEINDGVVTYQCRFIQSDVYKKNTSANRIVVTDFGTVAVPDPCGTIFHRISSKFSFKREVNDNTVITVYPFGDEIYTITETGVMYKVGKKNMETKTKVDFTKSLGIVTHSAHPHITEDGSMFDKACIVANIPARWTLYPSYMHSFGNYQSLCRFIVINRKTGRPVDEFYSRGFCYFHIINQYEDSNRVVIDICTFKDASIIKSFYLDAMKLIKVDVKNKTSKSWYEEGVYPSEPIFVPSPDAQDEDHGVILSSLIYGKNENCVSLLVLDAKSFEEIGRVKFETSSPVPRSTHGWYFPSCSP